MSEQVDEEQVGEEQASEEQASEEDGGHGSGPAGGSESSPAGAVGHALRDRILDWTEAGLWIALLGAGSLVALAILKIDSPLDRTGWPPAVAPDELIEAEDMPVLDKSRDFTFWLQPTSGFEGGGWSKDGQMFAFGTVKGDWIELELPDLPTATYTVELFLTKSQDYGVVQVSLNDSPVGAFDLWSGRGVVPTGSLDLGDIELAGDGDVLRLEVGGPNPRAAAPFFQFGIDGIRLQVVDAGEPSQGPADSAAARP